MFWTRFRARRRNNILRPMTRDQLSDLCRDSASSIEQLLDAAPPALVPDLQKAIDTLRRAHHAIDQAPRSTIDTTIDASEPVAAYSYGFSAGELWGSDPDRIWRFERYAKWRKA